MIKRLLCTGVLLLSATALRADVFNFSYGGPSGASGTLITSTLPLGGHRITDLWGTRNGIAISEWSLGNSFTYVSPSIFGGAFSFNVNGKKGTVSFASSIYTETGVQALPKIGSNFSLTRSVPEPTTMLLLFTMGLGVWVLARKLPSRNTRLS